MDAMPARMPKRVYTASGTQIYPRESLLSALQLWPLWPPRKRVRRKTDLGWLATPRRSDCQPVLWVTWPSAGPNFQLCASAVGVCDYALHEWDSERCNFPIAASHEQQLTSVLSDLHKAFSVAGQAMWHTFMHHPRPLSIAFANFAAPLGVVAVTHITIDTFDGWGADKVTLVMQHGREEVTTEAHRETRSETWVLSDTTAAHIDHACNMLAQLVHSAHPCEGPIHVYNIGDNGDVDPSPFKGYAQIKWGSLDLFAAAGQPTS